jgi:hypothetical protein
MSESKTAIANKALALINEPPIQTFEQAKNPVERTLKLFFDETYEEVCSDFSWNFCTTSSQLPVSQNTPIGWSNAFVLPNAPKTLRVFGIEGIGYADPDWERRGNEILINSDSCAVKYSYKVADTNLIPAHVSRCISTLLASKIAVPLLGVEGQSLASYYQNLYTSETRPNAQLLDANEGRVQTVEESTVMGGNFVDGNFVPSNASYNVNINAPVQDNPSFG